MIDIGEEQGMGEFLWNYSLVEERGKRGKCWDISKSPLGGNCSVSPSVRLSFRLFPCFS